MFLEKFFAEGAEVGPCLNCQQDKRLDFDIRMAFQPIVDARTRSVYGYEALVRTAEGGGAAEALARVRPELLYRFDQTCRVKAIATAAELGLKERLSVNFFPNAVYKAATCIRMTLLAAERCGFPPERLIFEAAESEEVTDQAHVSDIFRDYKSRGFLTAIDDFGAGYAGLSALVKFQPDLIKLDMNLIRGLESDPVRRTIVAAICRMASDLGCVLIAEGVETSEEYKVLSDMGIFLFQGFLFGKPALERIEAVPEAVWDDLAR